MALTSPPTRLTRRSAQSTSLLALLTAALWVASSCDARSDIAAHFEERSSVPGLGGTAGTGGAGGAGGAGGGEHGAHTLALTGDLSVHDPELVVVGDAYFLFSTGRLLPTKVSSDLHHWEAAGTAFSEPPAWISQRLPGVTDLWAPDVSHFSGNYHLYYAASTFGSGRSCIGHATSPDLTLSTVWQDQGYIICSDVDEVVDWDAIDPSTFPDENGDFWMVFGSYGSGIKLLRLDPEGNRLDEDLFSLAERPVEVAIQAPSAIYRNGYHYLFASFDFCCSGLSSTSNVRVGRASQVFGPYFDRDEVPMLEGGGTSFLLGNESFPGAGGTSLFRVGSVDYVAYHAYDASAAGQATLRIARLLWDEQGWPLSRDP